MFAAFNSQNMQFVPVAKHISTDPSTWFIQVSVFTASPCTCATTAVSKWKQNVEDNPVSQVAC